MQKPTPSCECQLFLTSKGCFPELVFCIWSSTQSEIVKVTVEEPAALKTLIAVCSAFATRRVAYWQCHWTTQASCFLLVLDVRLNMHGCTSSSIYFNDPVILAPITVAPAALDLGPPIPVFLLCECTRVHACVRVRICAWVCVCASAVILHWTLWLRPGHSEPHWWNPLNLKARPDLLHLSSPPLSHAPSHSASGLFFSSSLALASSVPPADNPLTSPPLLSFQNFWSRRLLADRVWHVTALFSLSVLPCDFFLSPP